jgi:TP901 family phage tail tape measure protein
MKVADLFAQLGIRIDPTSFAKARGAIAGFGGQVRQSLGKVGAGIGTQVGGAAGGLASTIGSSIRGAIGIAGAYAVGHEVVSVVKDSFEFEKALTRIQISSRGAIPDIGKFRDEILSVSHATGVSKEEILAGAQNFIELTGDAKAATESMSAFARASVATGTSITDISGASAALIQQLKVKPSETEDVLSMVARGGKAGAVEIKNMASLLGSLSSQFKDFQGATGKRGTAQMVASFEVIRRNFGSASRAETGFRSLIRSLENNKAVAKLEKLGIKPLTRDLKTGTVQMGDFFRIIDDISKSPIAHNMTAIQDIFKRQESARALKALVDNRDVLYDIYKQMQGATDIADDLAVVQATGAYKVSAAWNDVKLKMAEALSVENVKILGEGIKDLLSLLVLMIDGFERMGKMAKWAIGGMMDTLQSALDKAAEFLGIDKEKNHFAGSGMTPEDAMTGGPSAQRAAFDQAYHEGREFTGMPTVTTETIMPRGVAGESRNVTEGSKTFNATLNVNGGSITPNWLEWRSQFQRMFDTMSRNTGGG